MISKRKIYMRVKNKLKGLLGRPRVVVTMTSYPPRIGAVAKVIETIYAQSVTPDRIILWLVHSDFPEGRRSLPKDLLAQEKRGMEICFSDIDLKVHNKYFWTAQICPHDIIITIDDDILYRPDVIESLLNAYWRFPQAVSARRAHRIRFDESGALLPYVEWQFEFMDELHVARNDLFATGVAGVLYPPDSLVHEVMTVENIQRASLYNDDVWLKFVELLKDIPTLVCSDHLPTHVMIDGTQDFARWLTSNAGDGNDRQIAQVLELLNEYHGADDTLLQRIRRPVG
jgi:hypothetical protein